MLIPYNTDAPIYYFPYATIGLIAANIAAFLGVQVAFADGAEAAAYVHWLVLQYDQINPLQWITSNFMHGGIMHLVGNMIFLWGFGIIIEGKLGWLRFLGLYLLIGIVTCAFEQTLFFFLTGAGASLGASSIIFGLLAVAMVWAPKNELTCLLFIRFIPRTVDLPIIVYAAFHFAFEILLFALGGFAVSSALLHLFGVVVGLPLGFLYVHRKWVDCEGWDVMTVYFASDEKKEEVRGEFRDRNRIAELKEAKQEREQKEQRIIDSLANALQEKQSKAAIAIFDKFGSELQGGKKMPAKLLSRLVSAMHEQKNYVPSVPLLVHLLEKLPSEKAVKVRLTLAQILIKVTDQPKQAVAVLRKLPKQLPDKENKLRAKLAKAAKAALAEGSLEIEVHDW